jgi:delta 1-pyrroline-5-carboxylate dehydrogenase
MNSLLDTIENSLLDTFDMSQIPTRLLIGGEWVEPANGKRFATLNPATEDVLAEVSEAGAPEVDAAVSSAREALRHGPWSTMTGAERGRILHRLAALMRERSEELVLPHGYPGGDRLPGILRRLG